MNRFVERVSTHADRRPAKVVLPDVHRIERAVPSVLPLGEDVGVGDRIVVELELRDVILAGAHVLDEVIPVML